LAKRSYLAFSRWPWCAKTEKVGAVPAPCAPAPAAGRGSSFVCSQVSRLSSQMKTATAVVALSCLLIVAVTGTKPGATKHAGAKPASKGSVGIFRNGQKPQVLSPSGDLSQFVEPPTAAAARKCVCRSCCSAIQHFKSHLENEQQCPVCHNCPVYCSGPAAGCLGDSAGHEGGCYGENMAGDGGECVCGTGEFRNPELCKY
jgi:hypothetical protein